MSVAEMCIQLCNSVPVALNTALTCIGAGASVHLDPLYTICLVVHHRCSGGATAHIGEQGKAGAELL